MVRISDDVELDTTVESILLLIKQSFNEKLFKSIRSNGDNILTNCPFHKDGQENHPSFSIHKKDGVYNCFSCGEKGNLVELVARISKFSYRDARTWLLDNFPSVRYVSDNLDETLQSLKEKLAPKQEVTVHKSYVSEKELESYRYWHQYMYKRGLTNDIIEKFDVGFDKDFKVERKNSKGNIMCNSEGQILYNDLGPTITFPVRDITGGTLFIARRCINQKKFYYPDNVEIPIYGVYEINKYCKNPKEIWVCESIIDCLRLWCNDIPAVALNGLGHHNQYKELQDLPTKVLVLATDNDVSGQNARKNLKKNVKNKLIYEALIPKTHKDIGECSDSEIKSIKTRIF